MDNAFTRDQKRCIHQPNSGSKLSSDEGIRQDVTKAPFAEPPKRPKLSAALQDTEGDVTGSREPFSRMGTRQTPNRPRTIADRSPQSGGGAHSHPQRQDTDDGIMIPVKKFNPDSFPGRETRSMFRRNWSNVIQ